MSADHKHRCRCDIFGRLSGNCQHDGHPCVECGTTQKERVAKTPVAVSAPDTKLSEAVRELREAIPVEVTTTNGDVIGQFVSVDVAYLRTVLDEIERLRGFGALLVAGFMDGAEGRPPEFTGKDAEFFEWMSKEPEFQKAIAEINSYRAALRSVPRFTQEDAAELSALADGLVALIETVGRVTGEPNFRAPYQDQVLPWLRDLASRISQHLEGQKDG